MLHIPGIIHQWFLFMVLMFEMIMSPGVFFFFFKILIFRVVWGKNSPKWQENSVCRAQNLRNIIIWSWFMVHMCKKIICPGDFYFFPNFHFRGQYWGERAKVSVGLHIWVSIHHMIVLLHKFKMMTSSNTFFVSKFWFSGLLGGWRVKGQKIAQNDKKILSNSVSQELYFMWLWLLVHMGKTMISPAFFFFFFKILIFQVFQSSSINAKRKFWGVPTFFTCVDLLY